MPQTSNPLQLPSTVQEILEGLRNVGQGQGLQWGINTVHGSFSCTLFRVTDLKARHYRGLPAASEKAMGPMMLLSYEAIDRKPPGIMIFGSLQGNILETMIRMAITQRPLWTEIAEHQRVRCLEVWL